MPADRPVRRRGSAADAVAILERRIRNGDYLSTDVPGERELAVDLGVSYMTARKAAGVLLEQGLLARAANGRLVLAGAGGAARLAQVAFLSPAFPSADAMRWRLALDRAAAEAGCAVRGHLFTHWDDPALRDVLARGDGAFLYPTCDPLPLATADLLRQAPHRVVVVDRDWSALGLPSMNLHPPRFVDTVLDHLWERGHRRIACINSQPPDEVCLARMGQARTWAAARGAELTMIDEPTIPGQDSTVRAFVACANHLKAGRPAFTAIFGITLSAAIGAARALHEAGLRPGRDCALCTLNDDAFGHLLVPSITAAMPPDPLPWLRKALEWMRGPRRAWKGPLLMAPDTCLVAVRESTSWYAA